MASAKDTPPRTPVIHPKYGIGVVVERVGQMINVQFSGHPLTRWVSAHVVRVRRSDCLAAPGDGG